MNTPAQILWDRRRQRLGLPASSTAACMPLGQIIVEILRRRFRKTAD